MNLKKFAHFLAVVETKSFRKASEAVHLSPPALSRSLKSLEEELGVPLFDRKYGKVAPSAYSLPLVPHIRRVIAEARALEESVQRIKGLEEGEIRVGFGPFAAAAVLRPVMSDIIARHPKLKVRIDLSNSGLLLELLKQDRLDVVVADHRYISGRDDVAVLELPKQPMAFLVNSGHELARHRSRLTLSDFDGYAIGAPTIPEELLQAIRNAGVVDFQQVICDDLAVLLELVQNTPLIGLVPQLVTDETATRRDLLPLRVDVPFDRYAYPCIMSASGRILGPASTLLIELVTERFTAPRRKR